VLSKYPDQPEMVQDARGRIGRLPLTASTPAGGKNLRRICVGPDCEGGSISPDGRFLAAPTEEMVAFAFGTSRQVKNTGSLKTTQS
jgi:hypothetical protein